MTAPISPSRIEFPRLLPQEDDWPATQLKYALSLHLAAAVKAYGGAAAAAERLGMPEERLFALTIGGISAIDPWAMLRMVIELGGTVTLRAEGRHVEGGVAGQLAPNGASTSSHTIFAL